MFHHYIRNQAVSVIKLDAHSRDEIGVYRVLRDVQNYGFSERLLASLLKCGGEIQDHLLNVDKHGVSAYNTGNLAFKSPQFNYLRLAVCNPLFSKYNMNLDRSLNQSELHFM